MSYPLTTKTFIAMHTVAEIRLLRVYTLHGSHKTIHHLKKNIKPVHQACYAQSLALGKPELLDSTCHLSFCTGIPSEGISLSGYGNCHESDVAKALQCC